MSEPERAARTILQRFRNQGSRVGEVAMRGAVEADLATADQSVPDALRYGVQQNWFEENENKDIRLLPDGFKEIR